jgi:glutathione peroxidase
MNSVRIGQTLLLTFAVFGLTLIPSPRANAEKGTEGTIYSIPVETISGKKETLATHKGKVLLIVNTASECGYTSQYEGLQKIHEKFSASGFEVLGFPSNDFGAQEPGSNEEIRKFCDRKFKIKFPLFAKGPVGGKNPNSGEDLAQPIYQYLLKNSPTSGPVKWNFEKFLVSREGKVIGRFRSGVSPESAELTSAISSALTKK